MLNAIPGYLAAILILFAGHDGLALKVEKGEVIPESLAEYEGCQTRDYSGEHCHQALRRWVSAHPQDAFKAGKLTRLKMNGPAAIPFFTQAFERKEGNCKDEDVGLAVVGALNLPPANKDVIAQATRIGFDTCFNETKDKIVENASMDSYLFANVCDRMVAKGLLTGLKQKKCQDMKK